MNKGIRVLRIIARLNIGGPAIHTILLTHYLNTDIQTRLVVGEVSEGEESMDYLLDRYAVSPVYIHTLKRELSIIGDLMTVFSVYRIIWEFKPDIIHTHTAKAGAIGRAAGVLYNLLHFRLKKNRIRLVHSFHGHVFNGYFNKFNTFVFIMIERTLALFTDAIIAVSDSLKKELTENYKIASDKKIKVIYNGYDLEQFFKINVAGGNTENRLPNNLPNPNAVILNEAKRNEESDKSGKVHFLDSSATPQNDIVRQPVNSASTRSDETIITTVGRLVPIKGHRFLIDAFSKVKASARLIVVGDGVLKQELQDLSDKLGLSDRVEFAGYKKDIVPVYEKTDIFILTSLNEGAPVAVVEALASAKPVIATDVGGVKDLLGAKVNTISDNIYLCERGILIPPSDAGTIAAAIDYLVNNPEIGYRIGVAGREFVKKIFTIDRLVKDMTLLYTEVLEK